jgi:membrane-associated phospholipid phosphatase
MDDDMERGKLRERYGKTLGIWIPEYGFLSLIACFLTNCFVYWGSRLITMDRYHYDFTTGFDRMVPFVKEWIIIYFGCYVFWGVNYILAAREGKEKWFKFAFADILAKLICGVIFVAVPTTNIRPEVTGNDIFSILMRLLYNIDRADNLFPSLHCLMSWFCFIGIRRSKKVPLWYKVFSCVFAVMVCLSTQFTKQHYMVDVLGGILISELCYLLSCNTRIYLYIEKAFLGLNRKIFGIDACGQD